MMCCFETSHAMKWLADAPAQQRIDPPGDSGDRHQRGAQRVGGGHARRNEIDQPADGQQQAGPGQQREMLAAAQARREHRKLDRAEQDQRPGAGAEREIGEGKEDHIGEQHQRHAPVGGDSVVIAGPQRQDQPQRQRAGDRPHAGEARRVDEARPHRQPVQHRVGGETQHGATGQQQGAGGRMAENARHRGCALRFGLFAA